MNIGNVFKMRNRGGRTRRSALGDRELIITKYITKDDKKRISITIGIGVELVRQQRWITGDRITINISDDLNTVTLCRVDSCTSDVPHWKLTPRSRSSSYKDGEIVQSSVRLQANDELAEFFGLSDIDSIKPKGIVSDERGISFDVFNGAGN